MAACYHIVTERNLSGADECAVSKSNLDEGANLDESELVGHQTAILACHQPPS